MAVMTILPHVTPSSAHLQFINDEITDLAQDLMHDEPGMQLIEARHQALGLLDELAIYAASWDHMACCAGNNEARLRLSPCRGGGVPPHRCHADA